MKRFRIGHYLKTSLWLLPVLFVLAGVALSLITTSIDDGSLIPQSITGDPTAALQILYLISFSMLTLTGLVLSLVVVVVQLAMGIFSPRIVRQILQDRPSQAAIGLFAGTFTHSILAIREVRTTPDGGSVPGLAVVVAIALVLACIGALVWYLNHIGQSLRVAALVGWVADDTMKSLDHVYPDHGPEQDLEPDLIVAPRGGVVFMVDHDQLVALAQRADCRLEFLWAVGDFVPTGAALIRIVGDPTGPSRKAATSAIALGPERTMNQDVAYGIRMLVDIAERSCPPDRSRIPPPPCKPSTACTTSCDNWSAAHCIRGITTTRRARCACSRRPCTGTVTSGSRSMRFGRLERVLRKCRDASGPPSTTCCRWLRRTAVRRWSTS